MVLFTAYWICFFQLFVDPLRKCTSNHDPTVPRSNSQGAAAPLSAQLVGAAPKSEKNKVMATKHV